MPDTGVNSSLKAEVFWGMIYIPLHQLEEIIQKAFASYLDS